MSQARKVELSPKQRQELEYERDHSPIPYIRTRCAAILKVADGQAVRQVAWHGLLKRVKPDTVHDWIARYEQEGLAGLRIRPGRGRKPAFSPCAPDGSRRSPGGARAGVSLATALRLSAE